MTFDDIFQSDFLESMTVIPLADMIIAIMLSVLLGLYIFMIYQHSYGGIMCSSSFGTALIALSVITTVLMIAVVSNVVLSLGMVGALSIVRFRTAIKEPIDIIFLFWAIANGIILAAGLYLLAVIGSIVTGMVMLVFLNKKKKDLPYILIVVCDNAMTEKDIQEHIARNVRRFVLVNKRIEMGRIELNFDVRLNHQSSSFVNELKEMKGVSQASLVSYYGDYTG